MESFDTDGILTNAKPLLTAAPDDAALTGNDHASSSLSFPDASRQFGRHLEHFSDPAVLSQALAPRSSIAGAGYPASPEPRFIDTQSSLLAGSLRLGGNAPAPRPPVAPFDWTPTDFLVRPKPPYFTEQAVEQALDHFLRGDGGQAVIKPGEDLTVRKLLLHYRGDRAAEVLTVANNELARMRREGELKDAAAGIVTVADLLAPGQRPAALRNGHIDPESTDELKVMLDQRLRELLKPGENIAGLSQFATGYQGDGVRSRALAQGLNQFLIDLKTAGRLRHGLAVIDDWPKVLTPAEYLQAGVLNHLRPSSAGPLRLAQAKSAARVANDLAILHGQAHYIQGFAPPAEQSDETARALVQRRHQLTALEQQEVGTNISLQEAYLQPRLLGEAWQTPKVQSAIRRYETAARELAGKTAEYYDLPPERLSAIQRQATEKWLGGKDLAIESQDLRAPLAKLVSNFAQDSLISLVTKVGGKAGGALGSRAAPVAGTLVGYFGGGLTGGLMTVAVTRVLAGAILEGGNINQSVDELLGPVQQDVAQVASALASGPIAALFGDLTEAVTEVVAEVGLQLPKYARMAREGQSWPRIAGAVATDTVQAAGSQLLVRQAVKKIKALVGLDARSVRDIQLENVDKLTHPQRQRAQDYVGAINRQLDRVAAGAEAAPERPQLEDVDALLNNFATVNNMVKARHGERADPHYLVNPGRLLRTRQRMAKLLDPARAQATASSTEVNTPNADVPTRPPVTTTPGRAVTPASVGELTPAKNDIVVPPAPEPTQTTPLRPVSANVVKPFQQTAIQTPSDPAHTGQNLINILREASPEERPGVFQAVDHKTGAPRYFVSERGFRQLSGVLGGGRITRVPVVLESNTGNVTFPADIITEGRNRYVLLDKDGRTELNRADTMAGLFDGQLVWIDGDAPLAVSNRTPTPLAANFEDMALTDEQRVEHWRDICAKLGDEWLSSGDDGGMSWLPSNQQALQNFNAVPMSNRALTTLSRLVDSEYMDQLRRLSGGELRVVVDLIAAEGNIDTIEQISGVAKDDITRALPYVADSLASGKRLGLHMYNGTVLAPSSARKELERARDLWYTESDETLQQQAARKIYHHFAHGQGITTGAADVAALWRSIEGAMGRQWWASQGLALKSSADGKPISRASLDALSRLSQSPLLPELQAMTAMEVRIVSYLHAFKGSYTGIANIMGKTRHKIGTTLEGIARQIAGDWRAQGGSEVKNAAKTIYIGTQVATLSPQQRQRYDGIAGQLGDLRPLTPIDALYLGRLSDKGASILTTMMGQEERHEAIHQLSGYELLLAAEIAANEGLYVKAAKGMKAPQPAVVRALPGIADAIAGSRRWRQQNAESYKGISPDAAEAIFQTLSAPELTQDQQETYQRVKEMLPPARATWADDASTLSRLSEDEQRALVRMIESQAIPLVDLSGLEVRIIAGALAREGNLVRLIRETELTQNIYRKLWSIAEKVVPGEWRGNAGPGPGNGNAKRPTLAILHTIEAAEATNSEDEGVNYITDLLPQRPVMAGDSVALANLTRDEKTWMETLANATLGPLMTQLTGEQLRMVTNIALAKGVWTRAAKNMNANTGTFGPRLPAIADIMAEGWRQADGRGQAVQAASAIYGRILDATAPAAASAVSLQDESLTLTFHQLNAVDQRILQALLAVSYPTKATTKLLATLAGTNTAEITDTLDRFARHLDPNSDDNIDENAVRRVANEAKGIKLRLNAGGNFTAVDLQDDDAAQTAIAYELAISLFQEAQHPGSQYSPTFTHLMQALNTTLAEVRPTQSKVDHRATSRVRLAPGERPSASILRVDSELYKILKPLVQGTRLELEKPTLAGWFSSEASDPLQTLPQGWPQVEVETLPEISRQERRRLRDAIDPDRAANADRALVAIAAESEVWERLPTPIIQKILRPHYARAQAIYEAARESPPDREFDSDAIFTMLFGPGSAPTDAIQARAESYSSEQKRLFATSIASAMAFEKSLGANPQWGRENLDLHQAVTAAELTHKYLAKAKHFHIIMDEMGLGKTRTALATIAQVLEQSNTGDPRRVLVVAPRHAKNDTWPREIKQNLPHAKIVAGMDNILTDLDHGNASGTTFYLLHPQELQHKSDSGRHARIARLVANDKHRFDFLVVDESHHFTHTRGLKKSQRYLALEQLAALSTHRLGMSGTPTTSGSARPILSTLAALATGSDQPVPRFPSNVRSSALLFWQTAGDHVSRWTQSDIGQGQSLIPPRIGVPMSAEQQRRQVAIVRDDTLHAGHKIKALRDLSLEVKYPAIRQAVGSAIKHDHKLAVVTYLNDDGAKMLLQRLRDDKALQRESGLSQEQWRANIVGLWGGMNEQRSHQTLERFRTLGAGGSPILVTTFVANEGINLFDPEHLADRYRMVFAGIPWTPASMDQMWKRMDRMGMDTSRLSGEVLVTVPENAEGTTFDQAVLSRYIDPKRHKAALLLDHSPTAPPESSLSGLIDELGKVEVKSNHAVSGRQTNTRAPNIIFTQLQVRFVTSDELEKLMAGEIGQKYMQAHESTGITHEGHTYLRQRFQQLDDSNPRVISFGAGKVPLADVSDHWMGVDLLPSEAVPESRRDKYVYANIENLDADLYPEVAKLKQLTAANGGHADIALYSFSLLDFRAQGVARRLDEASRYLAPGNEVWALESLPSLTSFGLENLQQVLEETGFALQELRRLERGGRGHSLVFMRLKKLSDSASNKAHH